MNGLDIVLDTDVLFAGLYSNTGASFQILSWLNSGKFRIHVSVPLIIEYEAVLKEHCVELKLNYSEIDDFIDYLCSIAQPHKLFFSWRPCLNDPDDDMLIELAVSANCHYIISHNVKHFKAVRGFTFRTMVPGDFLKILRGK